MRGKKKHPVLEVKWPMFAKEEEMFNYIRNCQCVVTGEFRATAHSGVVAVPRAAGQ